MVVRVLGPLVLVLMMEEDGLAGLGSRVQGSSARLQMLANCIQSIC